MCCVNGANAHARKALYASPFHHPHPPTAYCLLLLCTAHTFPGRSLCIAVQNVFPCAAPLAACLCYPAEEHAKFPDAFQPGA